MKINYLFLDPFVGVGEMDGYMPARVFLQVLYMVFTDVIEKF